MAISWTDMDRMLSDLFRRIHTNHGSIVEKHLNDWRPFWELAKEIQALFKEGLPDISREDRAELWKRFNELRDEARREQTEERADFAAQSEHIRDAILDDCSTLSFTAGDQFTNYLVDSSNRAGAEEVKEKGRELGLAMKKLKENKHLDAPRAQARVLFHLPGDKGEPRQVLGVL